MWPEIIMEDVLEREVILIWTGEPPEHRPSIVLPKGSKADCIKIRTAVHTSRAG